MWDAFFNFFSHDLAIDLGTSNTLVLVKGAGIKIREPSVIALSKKTGKIVALGRGAEPMLGKTPEDILAVRPLKDGVIYDFEAVSKMLVFYIKSLHDFWFSSFLSPRPLVVVGIPSGVTEVERRAVSKAVEAAGARKCFLVNEPMAAAIGAGLKVSSPAGSFIVDIGGGTTEIALISLGGIVSGASIRIAGGKMDQNIVDYVKKERGLVIGLSSAETCKIEAGMAPGDDGKNEVGKALEFTVGGREALSGLPRATKLSSNEIATALKPSLVAISKAIRSVFEEAPPELVADVEKEGICLAGGGSLLRGLDTYLTRDLGVKVFLAKDPQTCVVRGCGYLLENKELLERVLR